MELATVLRRHVYAITTRRGLPPTVAELASLARVADHDVRSALQHLAAERMLVLQPDGEILMAPPFSTVPTPFVVDTSRFSAYANCAWDALGVPIMLRDPARIVTGCGCCGESMALSVTPDHAPEVSSIVHFAVPAAAWWKDIVFT